MKILDKIKQVSFILVASFLMQACSTMNTHTQTVKEKKENLPKDFEVIKAVGMAPISTQFGRTVDEKRLKAIKASKLDAYKELSERVYGQKINSSTTVQDMILGNESMQASVYGVIRGARVIKTYSYDDVYVTELELDFREIYRIAMSMAPVAAQNTEVSKKTIKY